MGIAGWSLSRPTVIWLLASLLGLGGLLLFSGMSKLEDPEFTIKSALVITTYPGATPLEVEAEVTEALESAIQQLPTVRELRSQSAFGRSQITVEIRKDVPQSQLPQVWDELRRKVADAQGQLPPGAGPSQVVDDFGDVYGILYALTGEGLSLAELHQVARDLRRDLVTIDGVGKVALSGVQREVITVTIPQARRVAMGISGDALSQLLARHNTVRASGRLVEDEQSLDIQLDGASDSVAALRDLLLGGGSGLVRLGDVAEIVREYEDPARHLLFHNGQPAIHIGISAASGGNVVQLGQRVQRVMDARLDQLPLGIQAHPVSLQGEAVSIAIAGFLINLAQAVGIVIAVLLLAMGWRAGLIIALNLLLTVLGTLLIMDLTGVALQRVSLGALIIAMGMLVDNAIVVVDGVMVRRRRGEAVADAARAVVGQTQWPLLLATAIAVLAFSAIGMSQDSTGEFTRSLFLVVLYSLSLSWLFAVTLTPLLCVQWLPAAAASAASSAVASPGPVARIMGRVLALVLRWRAACVLALVLCFAGGLLVFGQVRQSFFPSSARPQFILNLWQPAAADIGRSQASSAAIDAWLRQQPEVRATHASVGQGMLRFLLTYDTQSYHPAFSQVVVDVDDVMAAESTLFPRLREHLRHHHPEVLPYLMRFRLGPGSAGAVGLRLHGRDRQALRSAADQVQAIMLSDPQAANVMTDWRERVPVVQPRFNELRARALGITREDLANTLAEASSGRRVGLYREGQDLIPIIARAPANERRSLRDLSGVHLIRANPGQAPAAISVLDVLEGVDTGFDDALIVRHNRGRAITVSADPDGELASTLRARLLPQIEALPLPAGVAMEWVGEYKNSTEAQAALVAPMLVAVLLMWVLLVILFGTLRESLVIMACVPLVLVGVALGLYLGRAAFGFMPLLGLLSLIGMLIKNAIVLVDEIRVQRAGDSDDYAALCRATISRVAPVGLAAGTTILGMLPLIGDVFFADMAVAIMAGLGFATVLTLVAVPVFYALAFGIRAPRPPRPAKPAAPPTPAAPATDAP
ncbi:MAG: efflux RND transporter permease subunit [Planctomycetota bacterium]|nr:MAG: efflux RND transporter permease subunit [Planctomycetota bacterium]